MANKSENLEPPTIPVTSLPLPLRESVAANDRETRNAVCRSESMRLVKQGSSVDTEICKLSPAQPEYITEWKEREEDAKATRESLGAFLARARTKG